MNIWHNRRYGDNVTQSTVHPIEGTGQNIRTSDECNELTHYDAMRESDVRNLFSFS